jgi:hypothetical protein
MFWRLFSREKALERGEAARRLHSSWLSRAIRREKSYPRIPIRRVDQGGFDALMGTSYGRACAEAWWMMALEQVDDASDDQARPLPSDRRDYHV